MNQTESQVHVGPRPLGAVEQTEEDNADEYIGYLKFSTTGEVLVPREWLKEQWEDKQLPPDLFPRKPSDWSAYRRTMRSLLEDGEYREYEVYHEEYSTSFDCRLRLEKSDETGSNTFICYSDVFFPEKLIGEEGGDWRRRRLGYFDFVNEEHGGGVLTQSEIHGEDIHYEHWKKTCNRARTLFQVMKNHHNQSDLQKILNEFRNITNAVEIRRAVYFIGNHYEDQVESLSGLWQAMNRFKDDGEEVRIETTPVVNLQNQRELISNRVEEAMQESVETIVSEVIDSWDGDETADAIAREMMSEIGDSNIGEGISEYNALLNMKLSVKDILRDQMDQLKEEEQDVVQAVIDQKELGDV